MEAWDNLGLSAPIIQALEFAGFYKPTKIQEAVLPAAIKENADILGAAQTGSGKTLAFGIPIMERLLKTDRSEKQLRCLVLVPTRELVVQVKKQFDILCKFTDIKTCQIVGGLSQQKQERLLKWKPEIIVATPGRFWALVQAAFEDEYLASFKHIGIFVIDETDRMVERGHFEELEHIVQTLQRDVNEDRQTLVFSATLTFIHTAPQRAGKKMVQLSTEDKIKQLVTLSGMKKNRKVIDLTTKDRTAENLVESRMNCNDLLDKDTNLVYILKRYPGRTLIFVNSVDASKRMYGILSRLQFNPLPCLLHAKMEQKTRLKNLERFTESENSILIATDVAARGLDIKKVEHVIHYQVPKTTELYIHRSGRTARAFEKGITVLLVDQLCAKNYQKLQKSMDRDEELSIFPIDCEPLKWAIEDRVRLATTAEALSHRVAKINSKENWFIKAAEEADIELDETMMDQDDLLDSTDYKLKMEKKNADANLKALLKTPLPDVNQSYRHKSRYITPSIVKEFTTKKSVNAIETFDKAKEQDKKFKKGVKKLSFSDLRSIKSNIKLKLKGKK
uniref:RNA helicase n=1 Tax=Rhabditophanes sp. KR3021 TaxID=114890 RepID=A0AC35TPR4_9BILA